MKKYAVFIIGLLLSLFGYGTLATAWLVMTVFPEPESGHSSSYYACITAIVGILLLACGIGLCFFAVKKWSKSRKYKAKLLNTESGIENSTDPATAGRHRRIKRAAIWNTFFFTVLEIIFLVLLQNWLEFPLWEYWPIMLPGLLIFPFCMFAGLRWGYKVSVENRQGKR